MSKAYLGLGANLGDPREALRRAVDEIVRAGPRLTAESSVYRSPAEDFTDQPDFLNQVIEIETDLSPVSLLGLCLEVEDRMGRRRTVPKGPRTIDLDLLLYESISCRTDQLILPHPTMHRRGFVLVPLCEISPEAMHPVIRRTAGQLLEELGDRRRSVIRLYDPAGNCRDRGQARFPARREPRIPGVDPEIPFG